MSLTSYPQEICWNYINKGLSGVLLSKRLLCVRNIEYQIIIELLMIKHQHMVYTRPQRVYN